MVRRRGAAHALVPARKLRHRWRWLSGAVVLVLLLAVGWVAVTGYLAAQRGRELQQSIGELRARAGSLDVAGLAREIPRVRDLAAELESLTSGPVWWAAAQLPLVGPAATAVRSTAQAADTLGDSTLGLEEILLRLDPSRFADRGSIDVPAVVALEAHLRSISAAAEQASGELATIDAARLPSPLDAVVADAQDILPRLPDLLASAGRTLRLVPPLLGAQGPRTWFIALQNGAEARGTGGIIGAYALLDVDEGALTLTRAAARKSDLDDTPIPLDGMGEEFRELWGTDPAEWAQVNLSPHFPYTGELVQAGMAARGEDIDGVVALDAAAVAALMAGTGPITVRGVTVDAANAEAFFTRDVYARFPDVTEKDEVVVELLQATFERALAGPLDLRAMIDAFEPVIASGHLRMWSASPVEQADFEALPVGGVEAQGNPSQGMVVVNNAAGNKLDAYLHVEASYDGGECVDDQRASTMRVLVRNASPAGLPAYVDTRADDAALGAPKGSNASLVYLYVPGDAEVVDVTVDGSPVDVPIGLERGHQVLQLTIDLDRETTAQIVARFVEPVSAVRTPTLAPQTMANPQVLSTSGWDACRPGDTDQEPVVPIG